MSMAFLSPSPIEFVMIAIIALIVLGPSRLPEAARSVGKGMREMRASFQGGGDDEDDDDERGERRGPLPPGDEPEDDGVDDDASLDELRDDDDPKPAPRAERESVGAAGRS
jgi:TatA/E family protein of Tat protein translocase